MPTYTYRCWHCEHEIERTHSIKEDPVVYCQKCRDPVTQRVMKRVIQAAGIIKKGSGWTPKFHG